MSYYSISAEVLARKLQSMHTPRGSFFARAVRENPRLIEAMLFIQWHSCQPAGLEALVCDLVTHSAPWLGNAAMVKSGIPSSGQWTLEELFPIWKSFLHESQNHHHSDPFWNWLRTLGFFSSLHELKKCPAPALKVGLEQYNFPALMRQCVQRAKLTLAEFFFRLCQDEDSAILPEGYFAGLWEAMNAAMDRHAAVVEKQLAQTTVKEKVFRRLSFARDKNFPVSVLGDARLGKTASGLAWCNARPGAHRLVTIPETNQEWDFFAAHADALFIPYTTQTNVRALKRAVEFVIEHTKLFLVYDEFHYALPVRVTKRSAPHRLNWIRSRVVDRGLGCAFFATRQTYERAFDQFVTQTQYQMEQWIGRIAKPLVLSPVLEPSDLLNIARSHFPGVDDDVLELIVDRCIDLEEEEADQTEGRHTASGTALRHLRQVASYAQWLAETEGSKEIALEHVNTAWEEMIGNAVPQDAAASPPRKVRQPRARKPRELREAAEPPVNVQALPLERAKNFDSESAILAAG